MLRSLTFVAESIELDCPRIREERMNHLMGT
jgi:hypothetical protein